MAFAIASGLPPERGLYTAIVAGIMIGRLRLERYVADFVWQIKAGQGAVAITAPTWADRVGQAWQSTREIVGNVWFYVIVGIAVGAGIHGYVPEDALASIMGRETWWSVPAADRPGRW